MVADVTHCYAQAMMWNVAECLFLSLTYINNLLIICQLSYPFISDIDIFLVDNFH